MLDININPKHQQVSTKPAKPSSERYLSHRDEPDERIINFIEPEIEEDLARNRLFLKHRVWKRAKKFRKPSHGLF